MLLVLQRCDGEGDEKEKDGLFVDVPAEEKRGVGREGNRVNKGCEVGLEPQFCESDLEDGQGSQACQSEDSAQCGRIVVIDERRCRLM